MSKPIPIAVRLAGDVHECQPSPKRVRPGEIVTWDGAEPLLVFLPEESPFVEGRGPFTNGELTTVRSTPPLESGEKFVVVIAINGVVRKTKGDIIVT